MKLMYKTIFSIFLFTVTSTAAIEKLHIGIYIEALCKYSKQFISHQFRPAYESIKNNVKVDFYTFGKSKSFVNERGEIEFECQHGPAECERNKFQTCGLHQIGGDQDLRADFIVCTMGVAQAFRQCVKSLKLNQQEIDACVGGKLATELQLKMENASAIIAESGHVPTITFNGEYNVTEFYDALSNFGEIVMRKLSEIDKQK